MTDTQMRQGTYRFLAVIIGAFLFSLGAEAIAEAAQTPSPEAILSPSVAVTSPDGAKQSAALLRGPETAATVGEPAWQALGGADFTGWSGLLPAPEDATGLTRVMDGVAGATFLVPDGPKGFYNDGLSLENDGTIDARRWYGLRCEIKLPDDRPFTAKLTLGITQPTGRHNLPDSTSAHFTVHGKGWHTVNVPFESFDYNRGQFYCLKFVKQVSIKEQSVVAAYTGRVLLRSIRLVRGNVLHLDSAVRSLPADGGGTVSYLVTVTNCSDTPQSVNLQLQKTGWEGMSAAVTPDSVVLEPGATRAATIRVLVPLRLPGAAREEQTLVATANGGDATAAASAERLSFITVRRLAFPYLVFEQNEWKAVRAKADKYDWAKKDLAETIATADAFEVPMVPHGGIKSDQGTPAVFPSYIENKLWPCAIAWKLTGNKIYAQKVALFLRRFSDPENGFPQTRHASSQGIPQEGGLFEGSARAYDAIQDAGVLSDDDRRQIEQTFRIYIRLQIDGMADGGISNWSLFNLCPAAQCALAVQDMVSFNTLVYGTGGVVDHLRYGTMSDGWWYEMSLSYNLGCAEALTNLGLAARAFGIDLLNAKFPASLTQNVGLRPFEYENFLGMAFGKFGPITDTSVDTKRMWDGIVIYPDYRGIMFGMGDGHEEAVAGGRFEEAYYAYRDPMYAAIIKQGNHRDLLFGVAELPTETPKPYTVSGHSDNAGIAVLRSQTDGRTAREQIQVSFKYGTHGSYHGHFDRLALNSLERYGRNFYNPETSWFGYGSYMYKWWVQPSVSHNMVVVDAKMQEPTESTSLLFHSGKMMQAMAVENTARWSNPPYFGGYEQIEEVKKGDRPYVPIPENPPSPGNVTDYSEPIRSRRLIVVTDDYVLIADDIQAGKMHTFDDLMHLRGAALSNPQSAIFLGHEAQFDSNPLSSGQFITNVDRYSVRAPALIRSIHRIDEKRGSGTFWEGDSRNWETGGASSLSEPGDLHLDEHVLWPRQAEVRMGDYAESWNVGKRLTYSVQGDGKTLASGTFGAWILGSGNVDVDLTGLKSIVLSTQVDRGKSTLPTIFWGDARLVTADGREIPIGKLKTTAVNVIANPHLGRDYGDGPVQIAGMPCTSSVAAEPQDASQAATITLNLAGLNAVRFRASIGGDWPVGNQDQLRKTVSVRTTGKQAQFLTLIEPYETSPTVKSAFAIDAARVRVELSDGRVQLITIGNLDGAAPPVTATITETRNGEVIRTETASQ